MPKSSPRISVRWLAVATAVALGVAGYFYFHVRSVEPVYVTVRLDRGDIIRSVVATGTVNPVITVQVGTYDSGPIIALYADFNTQVKAGQLIAKIDPRPFQVKVDQDKATLANAKAQLAKDLADMAYKKLTFERDQRLLEANAASQDTVDSARSAADQAVAQVALDRANIQQQQANLEEAEVNLGYTNIISPVDGVVVSRNVDVGQTVAASFQTPTLFVIAKDLTQMQVDTNVSESDIGNVRTGDAAHFSVDAFPDREFEGSVGQVRQAPITVQNVVTYDVVVNVANPEFLLKPGMTANVTIITGRRNNVLRVPIQAFHFSPANASGLAVATSAAYLKPPHRRIWIDDAGTLRPVSIITGLNDGSYAEVLSDSLKPGDRVVVDEARPGASDNTSSPTPLRFPH